jgi:catechol 2,3-dioxygenase-like lactoylglutathione lyase family enzyme
MRPDPTAPGVPRLGHVGLTVPDLDEAVGFFAEVFGASVVFRLPRPEPGSDAKAGRLGADPSAHFALAMLDLGGGRVELLQWWSPRPEGDEPAPDARGGSHVALEVSDVDATLGRLRGHPGVRVIGEPVRFPPGATPGLTNAFALTPWGSLLEILSWEAPA